MFGLLSLFTTFFSVYANENSLLRGSVFSNNIHDREYYENKFHDWISEYKVIINDNKFSHMLSNFANNDDMIEIHNSKIVIFSH